jgi:hypothetical protein
MAEHQRSGSTFQHDNRACEPVRLHVPGQLFNPTTEDTIPCNVLNLSPEGAGVTCDLLFPQGTLLVLYVEGFGRFEGAVTLHAEDPEMSQAAFELVFSLGSAKKTRVSDMLSLFVREGLSGMTQIRQAKRFRASGITDLLLSNGQHFNCEIVDISLDGVSLRTTARPAVGEILNVGHARGQVARYHDQGIALRFVRDVSNQGD